MYVSCVRVVHVCGVIRTIFCMNFFLVTDHMFHPSLTHQVLDKLASQGIAIRVASPKLVMEEAPESYKDVTQVVDTCHAAGISKKCIKLRPIAVIKG